MQNELIGTTVVFSGLHFTNAVPKVVNMVSANIYARMVADALELGAGYIIVKKTDKWYYSSVGAGMFIDGSVDLLECGLSFLPKL